jgi:hypothetical protein
MLAGFLDGVGGPTLSLGGRLHENCHRPE